MTKKRFGLCAAATAALGVILGLAFAGGVAFASHQFPDVPDSSPFHEDVGWMVGHGIASGFPDGTFRPRDAVNRQQMARFLRNYNSGFHIASSTYNPPNGNSFSFTATCPDGERVLDGSGTSSASNAFMTDSYPSDTTQWTVRWESDNDQNIDPSSATVYALCAPDASTG